MIFLNIKIQIFSFKKSSIFVQYTNLTNLKWRYKKTLTHGPLEHPFQNVY
jgi:hypothetical protein